MEQSGTTMGFRRRKNRRRSCKGSRQHLTHYRLKHVLKSLKGCFHRYSSYNGSPIWLWHYWKGYSRRLEVRLCTRYFRTKNLEAWRRGLSSGVGYSCVATPGTGPLTGRVKRDFFCKSWESWSPNSCLWRALNALVIRESPAKQTSARRNEVHVVRHASTPYHAIYAKHQPLRYPYGGI